MNQIPQDVKETLDLYVSHRIPTGGFLEAVLSNDLRGAISQADDVSLAHLKPIVLYVLWEIPAACWGNRDRVEAWLHPTVPCEACEGRGEYEGQRRSRFENGVDEDVMMQCSECGGSGRTPMGKGEPEAAA